MAKTKATTSGHKVRLGFSLTTDAQILLQELKKKTGLNQAGIVELAIRRMAEAEGVKL